MEPTSSTSLKAQIIPNLQASKDFVSIVKSFFIKYISKLSSETLGWVSILFLHGATLPALFALMIGISDNPPPLDVIIMIWTGLLLLFTKAAIQKDMLNLVTIGLGFMVQALLMMLIFFK